MKNYILLAILFIVISACEQDRDIATQEVSIKEHTLIQYVNPFIGTKRMGHTYPGATTPFGMVQLSPETNQQVMYINGEYNPDTYSYCSGYQYEDSTIYGFSHTHFSGTGHSDL